MCVYFDNCWTISLKLIKIVKKVYKLSVLMFCRLVHILVNHKTILEKMFLSIIVYNLLLYHIRQNKYDFYQKLIFLQSEYLFMHYYFTYYTYLGMPWILE